MFRLDESRKHIPSISWSRHPRLDCLCSKLTSVMKFRGFYSHSFPRIFLFLFTCARKNSRDRGHENWKEPRYHSHCKSFPQPSSQIGHLTTDILSRGEISESSSEGEFSNYVKGICL